MPLSQSQIALHEQRLTRFAELRALGVEVWAICERMGISRKAAYKYATELGQRPEGVA